MTAFLLHHLLRDSARRTPDAVAAIAEVRATDAAGGKARSVVELRYRELYRQGEAVARALVATGQPPRGLVGLMLDKSLDALAAIYGILAAGCAYVPIAPPGPQLPARRAAQIIERCRISHVVAAPESVAALYAARTQDHDDGDGNRDRDAGAAALASLRRVLVPPSMSTPAPAITALAALAPRVAVTGWDDAATAARGDIARDVTDMDLAYILHTSGSTGAPKGVAITHRNALAFVTMATEFFAITARDRLLSHAPLHFDLSVFDLYCAAEAGACVVVSPPHYAAFPAKLTAWIADRGVTVWNAVASAFTLLADRGRLDRHALDAMRLCIFSGEVMPIRVLRVLRAHMPNAALYNVYGQTEANSSMYYRVDELPAADASVLPLGRAFPNFEVFAVPVARADGEHGERPEHAAPGASDETATGELYVRASTVAAGYYRDPERTAEKFVADPRDPVTGGRVYRTGDLVALDESGNYLFRGRIDNMIKTRGYRVELGEVELALSACEGVERAAVVAIPDAAIGYRLVGFVTARDGHALDPGAVRARVADRIPSYMVPDSLEIRKVLPSTSTGKIDRKQLRAEAIAARSSPGE